MTRAIVSYDTDLGGWTVTVPKVVGEESSVLTTLGTVWATASEALEVALDKYGTATLGAGTELPGTNDGTIE